MAKKGSLKKSLLASALSLTLSASMLIGTTFAWFTDGVTNAGNKIQAGTLDVDLYDVTTGTEVEVTETSAPLFKYEKWEPGYKASKVLKVQNNGTLALKFRMDIMKTASVGTADICDVIEVWATAPATTYDVSNYEWQTDYTYCGTLNQMMAEGDGAIHGTLLEGESAYQGIVLKMSEEAGNEYQGAIAEFDIALRATQFTYESDSYDDTYDSGAEYPWNGVVQLPDGVTEETFEEEAAVAMDEDGNFYSTFTNAINSDASVLYFEPSANLGSVTHLSINRNITIYGNGAKLDGDLAVDFAGVELTEDTTITLYDLDGAEVWGSHNTPYTLNVNMYNCDGASRVYLNGTGGVTNITMVGCDIDGTKIDGDTAVYTNANGDIVIEDCTFTNVPCVVNFNHKVAGVQNVTVKNNTFIDCATTGTAAYYAPVRLYNSVVGAHQNVIVTGNEYVYTEGKAPVNGADILLNKVHNGVEASGTIEAQIVDGRYVTGQNVVVGTVEASTSAGLKQGVTKGGNVVLGGDIEVTESLTVANGTTIDGNGYTITTAGGYNNRYTVFAFGTVGTDNVAEGTIKNVVFDGVNGGSAIRTVGTKITIEGCVFKNSNQTYADTQAIVRLNYGTAIVKDCVFEGNVAPMGISFNYDADGDTTATLSVSNVLMEGNTFTSIGAVYYAEGGGCEIDGCSFVENEVSTTANGALVYLGFADDCSVKNSLFENNSFVTTGTSKRIAGAVMFGSNAVITGNAFINNTSVNGNGFNGCGVCTSAYYHDLDISGNYWGGAAPVNGVDYQNDEFAYRGYAVIVNSYFTTYTVDADGVGVTVA